MSLEYWMYRVQGILLKVILEILVIALFQLLS
jgi:hypothetical protein